MGKPISELKKNDSYRIQTYKNRRENVAMTLYQFLLENRDMCYTIDELVDVIYNLGFERKNKKQIISSLKQINKKRWRRLRPTVDEKIQFAYIKNDDGEKIKIVGIRSEMK